MGVLSQVFSCIPAMVSFFIVSLIIYLTGLAMGCRAVEDCHLQGNRPQGDEFLDLK
jgi:hypothetical protein